MGEKMLDMLLMGRITNIIYLIRHGETIENRENIIQGQLDGKLTQKGRDQMYRLGEIFKKNKIPLDLIVQSEMGRSKESAALFLEGYGKKVTVLTNPLINERYWGEFQGKKVQDTDLYKILNNPDISKQINEEELYNIGPKKPLFRNIRGIDTIEPVEDFIARGKKFYEQLLRLNKKNIAVIGHEWMSSAIINAIFDPIEEDDKGNKRYKLYKTKNGSYLKLITGCLKEETGMKYQLLVEPCTKDINLYSPIILQLFFDVYKKKLRNNAK